MTMLANRLVLLFPLLATAIAAQVHDPAPVRIAAEAYGSSSGDLANNTLSVRLDAGMDESKIVVAGGPVGGFGFLIAGMTRVSLTCEFDLVLLVSPDVIMPLGLFGKDGTISIPADLMQKDLVGSSVFLQAVSISSLNAVWLSAGLELRFVAGNAQPALGYDGPPSVAVLIAEAAGLGHVYSVVHEVTAPTTAWELTESGRDTNGGVTKIYMKLEAPAPDEMPLPVLETSRQMIDLGTQAEPLIEIWIEQTVRTVPGPTVFKLAAQLQRNF